LLEFCRPLSRRLESAPLGGLLRGALLSGALVVCASVMAVDQYNPFIYFRF
jgi:hypothetical protein